MELKVQNVEEMTTLLNFDRNNKDYQTFIETGELYQKHKTREIEECLEKQFCNLMEEFLILNMNLDIDSSEIAYRPSLITDFSAEICCGTQRIIPKKDIKTKICFEISRFSDVDILKAWGYLKSNMTYWGILEDFLELSAPSEANGLKKPKIKIERKLIRIASIEHIPKVLKVIDQIYNYIGRDKLDKLYNLKEGSIRYDTNSEAASVLRTEYQNRLELLLPSNLF